MLKRYVREITFQVLLSAAKCCQPKKENNKKLSNLGMNCGWHVIQKKLMYIQWLHFYFCAISENRFWYQKLRKLLLAKTYDVMALGQ